MIYDDSDPAAMRAFLLEESDSVALARFTVPLRRVGELLPLSREGQRWLVPRDRIPELNRHLRQGVVIAERRDELDDVQKS